MAHDDLKTFKSPSFESIWLGGVSC